jgi:group I intron endonuclease
MYAIVRITMGVIYRILNKINGKIYIGETTRDNPNERWMEHKRHVLNGAFGCRALYSAMTKYGIDNFEFKILFFCFNEDVEKYEIQMIEKLNTIAPNGYNILKGGKGGGFVGKKHTEDAKRRISEHFKKRYEDVKEREKMSIIVKNAMKGVNIYERMMKSDKWKKAVEEKRVGATLGSTISDDVKEKIRKGVKKYYDNDDNKINIEKHREAMAKSCGIKVSQYDSNHNLLGTYISAAEAARQTGIPRSTVQNAIKHGKKTLAGHYWIAIISA